MRNAAQLREASIATGYYLPFVGDGASVPWIEIALVNPVLSATLLQYRLYLDSRWPHAFKLHDFLYTAYGGLISATREEADAALREEVSRDSPIDGAILYRAVRVGGLPYWGRARAGFVGMYLSSPYAFKQNTPLLTGVTPMAGSRDLVVVTWKQLLDNQPMYNSLMFIQHAADLTQFGIGDMNALRDWIDASITAVIAPLQSVALTYVEIRATSYGPCIGMPVGPGPYTHYVNPPMLATGLLAMTAQGAITGDYLPRTNAVKAARLTGYPQRRKRGSLHIGGIAESHTLGDRLTVAALALWDAAMTTFILDAPMITTGGNTIRWLPVVYSPTQCNDFATIGTNADVFTAEVNAQKTNSKVGTMVKRKLRGGAQ